MLKLAGTRIFSFAVLIICFFWVPAGFAQTSLPPTISEAFNPFVIPLRTGGTILPISTLTFTLTNPNSVGNFTGLGFSDSLTGLAVAATPGLTNTCGGTWVPAAGDTVLNLTGGSLSASQSCTVSVNVTGTQPGQHNNQAGAPFSIEGGTGVPGNIAPMAVVSPPNIFMAVEPFAMPPTSVPLNQPFGLFLQVSDPNFTIGLSGIGFTDTFPAGLVFNGVDTSQCSFGVVTPTITFGNNTISVSNLNFNGAQSCQFSLNMVGTTPGPKTNTIPAATSNEGGTGGPYSVTIDVVAPPAISQTFAPASVAPNTSSTLTINLSNPSGNDVGLPAVGFTETLPPGLSITSNGGVSQCGGTFTTTSPDSIALTGATLAVGGQCQLSIPVAASAAGVYTATTSAVTSANGGTGSTASATLTVDPTLTGLSFVPVTPCRIADTRNPAGPFGGPFLQGQAAARAFDIPNSACGIPNNAQAYALNITVVPHSVLGFLTAFPCGQPQPLASNLNSDGRTKAVAGILPAGTNGAVCFFVTHDTDLVLDINGYFVPNTDVTALAFYPMAPCRLVDTRLANGPLGGPSLVAGLSRDFPLLSSPCNIPSTARAYSLNYTAVPHGPLGFLTTWPTGVTQPFVSTLNAPTGANTANAAIVPAGTNGDISVFVTHPADLVIDVNGYFAPPGPGGLSLHNLTPCRVLDTRNPAGSPPFNGTINLNVAATSCGAPAAAQSYVLNATVVPPGPLGFLTLWPQGSAQPLVSTLNAGDGAITSNLAIVPAANGSISIFGSNPTHVVMDISGYFVP